MKTPTLKELKALAKRAGATMWYAKGIRKWCIGGASVYHEFTGNRIDKRKVKYILLGLIAEREGLVR